MIVPSQISLFHAHSKILPLVPLLPLSILATLRSFVSWRSPTFLLPIRFLLATIIRAMTNTNLWANMLHLVRWILGHLCIVLNGFDPMENAHIPTEVHPIGNHQLLNSLWPTFFHQLFSSTAMVEYHHIFSIYFKPKPTFIPHQQSPTWSCQNRHLGVYTNISQLQFSYQQNLHLVHVVLLDLHIAKPTLRCRYDLDRPNAILLLP